MNQAQRDRIQRAAQFIAQNTEQREHLPKGYQLVADLWDILSDGEWHTSVTIAEKLDKSHSHTAGILNLVKEPWGLATSNRYGFMLPTSNVIIV